VLYLGKVHTKSIRAEQEYFVYSKLGYFNSFREKPAITKFD